MSTASPPRRARNAPEQYDDLAPAWWDARGPFAALHWLAAWVGVAVLASGGLLLGWLCRAEQRARA